ncbi:Rib/alpha-like domain-containing protein, partial [Ligilactobacillus equi]|uniref:Rib/alpha-like domain-containing protein n=2 Tax=Ligilactobacillus equi TaxID=137357 RepID=UPI00138F6D5E
MVSKNNTRLYDQKMNRNKFHYTIKKLNVGVASVLVGIGFGLSAAVLSGNQVKADQISTSEVTPAVSSTDVSVNTVQETTDSKEQLPPQETNASEVATIAPTSTVQDQSTSSEESTSLTAPVTTAESLKQVDTQEATPTTAEGNTTMSDVVAEMKKQGLASDEQARALMEAYTSGKLNAEEVQQTFAAIGNSASPFITMATTSTAQTMAEKYEPHVQDIELAKMFKAPAASNYIANANRLPYKDIDFASKPTKGGVAYNFEDITYRDPSDNSTLGTYTFDIKVTYLDNSFETVSASLNVVWSKGFEAIIDDIYDTDKKITGVGPTLPRTTGNAGDTYIQLTKKVGDTYQVLEKRPYDYNGSFSFDVPDIKAGDVYKVDLLFVLPGLPVDTESTKAVSVVADPRPDVQRNAPYGTEITVDKGTTLTSKHAEEAIANTSDLSDVVSYSWESLPDTSTVGKSKPGVVRVTYADNTSDLVNVKVNVVAKPKGQDINVNVNDEPKAEDG